MELDNSSEIKLAL